MMKMAASILKKIILFSLVAALLSGGLYLASLIGDLPQVTREAFLYQLTDPNEEDGILILPAEEFIPSLEALGPYVLDALLSVEDQRFYRHSGVDFRRLLGAVLANLESGFGTEGGSTITQQLVKITWLDQKEKTLRRKQIEAITAFRVERMFSKDEILLSYLNKVYFGPAGYGIQNATRFYFGKEPGELGLEESAIITGIIQNPTLHSPINRPESMVRRARVVLSRMLEQGKITPEQEAEARINLGQVDYIRR